ncbi:hypothetical protein F5888DRAFT_1636640 [Russula emetica]|nr:hypothetical protein F5888DRAFT_1636640 [Russula emetica]
MSISEAARRFCVDDCIRNHKRQLDASLNVILPYKFGVFEDADGSIIGLEPICPPHAFDLDLDPAFILDMSVVTFGVDLEEGLISEHSTFRGAGMVGRTSQDDDTPGACRTERQPGTGNSEGVDVVADSDFGNTSEKTSVLYPIQSERHVVDVVLERWKGGRECILLAGLLAATISLFIIEGYNTSSSQDVVDQAVALFNQVTSLDQPLGPDAVPLERSSSVVRATTLWLLSLWLNITCFVWVSWQKWRQQCIDLLGPHMPAPLRPYLFPGVGTRLAKYHVMEENLVLLSTSVIIFFVGLVDFLLRINKTITWVLLGYLTPLAFLYAAVTLLPCHLPNLFNSTLSPVGRKKKTYFTWTPTVATPFLDGAPDNCRQRKYPSDEGGQLVSGSEWVAWWCSWKRKSVEAVCQLNCQIICGGAKPRLMNVLELHYVTRASAGGFSGRESNHPSICWNEDTASGALLHYWSS